MSYLGNDSTFSSTPHNLRSAIGNPPCWSREPCARTRAKRAASRLQPVCPTQRPTRGAICDSTTSSRGYRARPRSDLAVNTDKSTEREATTPAEMSVQDADASRQAIMSSSREGESCHDASVNQEVRRLGQRPARDRRRKPPCSGGQVSRQRRAQGGRWGAGEGNDDNSTPRLAAVEYMPDARR